MHLGKSFKAKFFLLLITLASWPNFSLAFSTHTATIDNSSQKTVTLHFGSQHEWMIAKFLEWEDRLREKNLDVRFLLGAGELRRAVLGIGAEGPGDVEVFIHFEDRDLNPLSLHEAYSVLREAGVDIVSELNARFPGKKIDTFLKDRRGLNEGKPYRGDYGFFDNMGDTSLNQLVYSPSKKKFYGNEENLKALGKGKILFLEQAKVAELAEAKKISGTDLMSRYSFTILKQALRTLRLRYDLMFSANPNSLELDNSFKNVDRGFELFFGNASDEELSKYSLSPEYMAHFVKLFKNRTYNEKQKSWSDLQEHYPRTCEIFKALGLDPKPLLRLPPGRSPKEAEFLAIKGNMSFEVLNHFVDKKTLKVANPFKKSSAQKTLLALHKGRGLSLETPRLIPDWILLRYSPQLAYMVRDFDSLDRASQNEVLEKYLKAISDFHGYATVRLDQVKFSKELYSRFSFVDLSHLEEADSRSLLSFIEDEHLANPTHKRSSLAPTSHNSTIYKDISDRIDSALAEKKNPTLLVDLDDTLFISDSRDVFLLQQFDEINGSKYFKESKYQDLKGMDVKDYVFLRLLNSGLPYIEAETVAEAILAHVFEKRWTREAYQSEQINLDFVEQLRDWKKRGAKIIFLTARSQYDLGATREQLNKLAFNDEHIITMDRSKHKDVAVYKLAMAAEISAQHQVVAVIDDNEKVIAAFRKNLPQMNPYQILMRYEDQNAHPGTFLARQESDALSVYGAKNYSSQCLKALGTKPKAAKATKKKKT